MINVNEAKKSEIFTVISTIAGGKAHRVSARTLLEDAEAEKFVRMGFVRVPNGNGGFASVWGEITQTVTLEAGTVLHYHTQCGTIRSAGDWKVFRNDYKSAESITCTKCLKKEA